MTVTGALRRLASPGLALLLVLLPTGCMRREGRNSDCVWSETNAQPLDTSRAADARHLHEDVELAEDLAIRHMDAQHRLPPAQRSPGQTLNEVMNTCRNSLLKQISESHRVAPAEVVQSFGRRSLATDVTVIVPFLLLYGVVAVLLSGWILRRYPPDEGMGAVLAMSGLCSLALGVVGVLAGEQWSVMAEGLRIGTGHLSYRVQRLPWVQHRTGFFVLCVAVFWGAVFRAMRRVPQRLSRSNARNSSISC